ncbi:outer membrane protein assembly factor BamB family protein, partial [Actinoallomurus acaciae]
GLAAVGGGTAAALAATSRGGHAPSPPRLLWRATLPVGNDILMPQVFARAVVVFAATTKSSAYDAATGRSLWSAPMHDVATDHTLIYAPSAEDGDIAATDPYSHARRWSFPQPPGFTAQALAGPANGLLALIDEHGTVIGLDARTGRRRWTHDAPATTLLRGVQGGVLIAWSGRETDAEKRLFALDAGTGAVRWNRPYPKSGMTFPGAGDLVFGSPTGDTVEALSVTTGRTAWTADVGDLGRLTVANGTVHVGGAVLHALDLATGRQKWAYRPTVPGDQDRTSLVSGGHAYVLDNRNLIALDAGTGRRLWPAGTPAGDTAPLVAAGGLVCTGVAGTTGPGLYGWNAVTGELVWNHPMASSNLTDPWALTTAGSVLAASQDSILAAFHLARA